MGFGWLALLPGLLEDLSEPLEAAAVAFRPIHGSTGTLSLPAVDLGNVPLVRDSDGNVTLLDFDTADVLDPANWEYTTADGTRLAVERVFGLRSLTDRHGNTVNFSANSITHSGGESIMITRDASGRVTAITDPDGDAITYSYDAAGYLAAMTNRIGAVTSFEYVPHPVQPGRFLLDSIIDPLGNRALAADYDGDGRLIGQVDALGREVAFTHDIPNRRQLITDRLGHSTLHEYDLRGNVVRTVDPLGQETLREYDERDNEVRTVDAMGHVTERSFDAANNLLAEVEFTVGEGGVVVPQVTSYSYDAFGNPLTITDPLDQASSYSYDSQGALLEMVDATGGVTSFSYDGAGNLTEMVDPLGNRTEHTVDARGQVTRTVVRDSANQILSETDFTFDSRGNLLSRAVTRTVYNDAGLPTGTESIVTEHEFDAENRLTRTLHPDGTATETVYNAAGLEIARIDALGLVTSHIYDAAGNRVRSDLPDGTYHLRAYDAEGRLLTETQHGADGTVLAASAHEYDALGRRTSTVRADQLNAQGLPEGPAESTVYDAIGRVVATIDARGHTTTYEYDGACGCSNRRARIIDPLGHITSFTYDAAGNQVAVTDARGHTTAFEYDAQNRPTRTIHATPATVTETEYDAAGRRAAVIDELGRRTEFSYDALGRLVAVTLPSEASGEGGTTSYAYDEAGNRIAQTLPSEASGEGGTTRYQYDRMGRRIARIIPGGQKETYSYNAVGQLITRTDFDGRSIHYVYDALGRLVAEHGSPDHPSSLLPHAAFRQTYAYDAAGRQNVAQVRSSPGTGNQLLHEVLRSYDLRSRLTQARVTHWRPATADHPVANEHVTFLTYSYDEADNLLGVMSSNSDGVHLEYTYDPLNRLASVLDHGAQVPPLEHTYTYNAVGSLESLTTAHGISHTYTYNARNHLTGLAVTGAQFSHSFAYTLNALGHRTQIAESSGRVRDFTYDHLNRLTREVISGDPLGPNGTVDYTMDLVGNRLSRVSTLAGVSSESYAYDANDRLLTDITDASGNTLASPGFTVADTYDPWNRLVRRVRPDSTVIDLAYDASGNRVAKEVTTGATATFTAYLVDTNSLTGYAQVLEELRPGAGPAFALHVFRTYAIGHNQITMTQSVHSEASGEGGGAPGSENWTTHTYLHDGQVSVWGLANLDGHLTDRYHYDAFGSLIFESGSTPNLYRYTGEQWDPDLGHYYLRARYYEPDRGRFWTMDSYEGVQSDPQSLHKYLYAHANPVMGTDPSGMYSLTTAVKAMSIVGTLTALANVSITGIFAARVAGGGAGPTGMMLSVGITASSGGVVAAGNVHLPYINGKGYVGFSVEAGLDAISVGMKNRGWGYSLSFGFLFNTFSANELSGWGVTATWPISVAHLIPKALIRALAGSEGNMKSVVDILIALKNGKRAGGHRGSFRNPNAAVQIGLSGANGAVLSFALRSNDFTSTVGYSSRFLDQADIVEPSGPIGAAYNKFREVLSPSDLSRFVSDPNLIFDVL